MLIRDIVTNNALRTLNNTTLHQTCLVYCFIIIIVSTSFDPIGSSSGLHYEPVNLYRKVKQKVKQFHYRHEQAQRFPES
jgi:hypothetical protein